MTIEVTQQVNEIVVTAVADPTVRVVLEHVSTSGGGTGDGNVVAPTTPVIDGFPVVFDGTTGKRIKQGAINSPGGVLILNENGVAPETTIGANMVRHSELDDAIATHTAAPDPHGDRAYADSQVNALADATDTALSGKVGTSDPRLSDARTPTAHTHPLSEVSDFPAPDAVGNVLTSTGSGWASQAPSGGGGGFGSVPNRSGSVFAPPVANLAVWGAGSTDRAYYVPISVDPISVNGLEIAVSTVGAVGEVFRLGLYTDLNGIPDSLVIDAGTVGTDSTGNKRATFSTIDLPAGWYWLTVASQGGNTSRLRGSSAGIDRIPGIMGTTINASLGSALAVVPGALPATALVSPYTQPGRPSIGLVIA